MNVSNFYIYISLVFQTLEMESITETLSLAPVINREVDRETPWKDKEVPILRRAFRFDGATFIAYNTLMKNLACYGLKFIPNDENAKPTMLWESIVQKKGSPLVDLIVREMYTFGYCTFRVVEDTLTPESKKKIIYPQIVEREFYTGKTIIYKDGRRKYVATLINGTGNPVTDRLYVLAWESMMPDPITGQHLSIVALCQYEFDYKLTKDHFHLLALSQRSKPPVVVEFADPAGGGGNLGNQTASAPTGTNVPDRLYALRLLKTPGHETDGEGMTSGEANYVNNLVGNPARTGVNVDHAVIRQHVTDLDTRARRGYENATDDSVYLVERGLKMASKQPNLPEIDTMSYDARMEYMKIVLKYWSIPTGMVETNETGTGNLRLDNSDLLQFNITLQSVKKMVLAYIEEIYQIVLNTDELDGKFILDSIPRLTLQQALTLYAHDVIDRKTTQEIALKLCALPLEYRLEGKNDHHVPPIGLAENATTRLIDAREKGILATAFKERAEGSDIKETHDARVELTEAQAKNQEEQAKHQGDKPAGGPPAKKSKKS